MIRDQTYIDDRVMKTPDGCWLWTLSVDGAGYGHHRRLDRSTVGAHRLSYEIHVGSIPDGLELDHLCSAPSCVNPAHLEPVTHRENMRRVEWGERRPARCRRGHSDWQKSGEWRRCRVCLNEYQRGRS